MKKLFTVLTLALVLGLASAQQTANKQNSTPPPPPPTKARMSTAKQASPTAKMAVKNASSNSAIKLKKDGTPDKRYKANEHLKKDGTPDKRYKK